MVISARISFMDMLDNRIDNRSGQERRKENVPTDVDRRGGMDRRLSDQDHRVMLEAEKLRWEADIAASFAELKKKATESLGTTLSEIEIDGRTKFDAAWARYITGQAAANAEMDTNPVGAGKILEVAKNNLEGTVQEIKGEGEKVLGLKNIK